MYSLITQISKLIFTRGNFIVMFGVFILEVSMVTCIHMIKGTREKEFYIFTDSFPGKNKGELMEDSTYYAPAERSSSEQILKEKDLIYSQEFFSKLFGAMNGIGAVINNNRQIIYANNELLSLLGINTLEPILGKRAGEVLSCIHSAEEPFGCGTSRSCSYCGAINTILESQRTGQKSMNEAQISSMVDGKHRSWDLNIVSTPISFNGDTFYVLALQDISNEKRRAALERIFFHDLLNSVGGLTGLLTLLKENDRPEDATDLINLSEKICRNILEEIMLQREIQTAENGELKVNIELVNSIDLLNSAIGKINFHESCKQRNIVMSEDSANVNFETDSILLQRVIINLLKNALEATPVDGVIMAGVGENADEIVFWVRNDQVMSTDVQMQLFQRSFSTKGEGRGLGTYSIRLLTENYLGGKVSFVSNEKDGTIFRILLNKKFPGEDKA
jgi:nitrogen-specific signal transduction histidine kinase